MVPKIGLAFKDGFPIGPIVLHSVGKSRSGLEIYLKEDVAKDFLRMVADAKFQANLILRPVSGFRDMALQTALYAKAVSAGAARFALLQQPNLNPYPPTAKPGFSNHQAGEAIDYDSGMTLDEFRAGKKTAIFNWVEANAAKYGFKRLPSESWHLSRDGR